MPDFYIIGAPKCGTSSLFQYLGDHPSIYMPSNKEPHFYATDMYTRDTGLTRRVADRAVYEQLFAPAAPDQITGEGSTWYLFSEDAVPAILRDKPDARFIIMLRNPIDMALSLHNHHVRKLYDDVDDFSAAWSLNAARARGENLPQYCPEPKMLDYRAACRFAPMLERLFGLVPRERVHVIIFEEFVGDLRSSYLETLSFLGVADDGRTTFERVNPNRRLRSKRLYELLTYKPFPINVVYPTLKWVANVVGFRPGRAVFERNVTVEARSDLDPDMMRRLETSFVPDIPEIEAVLGRNLDIWRTRIAMLQKEA